MIKKRGILFVLLVIWSLNVDAKPIFNTEKCAKNESCISESNKNWKNGPSPQEICKFCDIMMPIARYLIDHNDTKYFPDIAIFICQELNLADKVVCEYAIKAYEVSIT